MAKKTQTESFTITRKMLTSLSKEKIIDKKFNTGNRIYNRIIKYCKKAAEALYADRWYQQCISSYKKALSKGSEKSADEWYREILSLMEIYGLDKQSVEAYADEGRRRSCQKALNSHIVQKLSYNVFASVKKAVFRNTKIHYRKYRQTCSLEGKNNKTGIIYREKEDIVDAFGLKFRLARIRKKDSYLMEAMRHRVKYCRVVRKSVNGKYVYFLQLICEGSAPAKLIPGKCMTGIDEGISTCAYVSDSKAGFFVLADGVERYEKEITKWTAIYGRRRRFANPDCYNEDGTIKKGAKFKNHTKGMEKALMKLKSSFRKKTTYVKNKHGYDTNRLIEESGLIIKEPMNYSSYAKRSKKKAERKTTSVTMKKSSGEFIQVFKFKKKKRFGKSVNRRSPGLFNSMLELKAKKYGIPVINVNIRKYKASQYDHVLGEYIKPSLSERVKKVGGKRVQRDLYSAFLLWNMQDEKTISQEKCRDSFPWFLKKQAYVVNKLLRSGEKTRNFGIREFVNC